MKVLLVETMWTAEIFSFFFWNFDAGNLLDWKFEILVGILNVLTDKKQIAKTLILSSKRLVTLGQFTWREEDHSNRKIRDILESGTTTFCI